METFLMDVLTGAVAPESEWRADFEAIPWAREHGFCPQTVYDVISGRLLGTRGEAHRVAVTLGIKEGAI